MNGVPLTLTICCPKCREEQPPFKVGSIDHVKWQNGMLIQKAMPYLTTEQRELLISGYCSPCFDQLFAEDCRPDIFTKE
jgi:hypothetical protein